MRAHPAADVLGPTFTQLWDTLGLNPLYYDLVPTNEWVATDLINADTGRNLSSCGRADEYYMATLPPLIVSSLT